MGVALLTQHIMNAWRRLRWRGTSYVVFVVVNAKQKQLVAVKKDIAKQSRTNAITEYDL